MKARTAPKLAIPAGIVAAGIGVTIWVAAGAGSPQPRPRAARPRTADPAVVQTTAPRPPARPMRQPPVAVSARGLEGVVRRFLVGWLACTYHQASCAHVGGSLPAYAAALDRQQGRALPTPAELAAHPRVQSVRLIRACRRSEMAVATYLDGHGGRFQLHLNLVRAPEGWRVFDVAEAPPHIPLPPPLTHGPRGC
jgi:hypothetical protein